MIKRNMLTATLVTVLMSGMAQADDKKTVTPWPPVTTDIHAPGNWPVPHPAPAINLDDIPSGQVFHELSVNERKGIQAALVKVGLYSGEINGIWGEQTWLGVRSYAQTLGYERRLETKQGSLSLFRHILN